MEEEKQNPKKPEKEMNSAHFCWCINQSIEFPKKKNKTTNELDPWKLQMTLHYILGFNFIKCESVFECQ